MLVAKEFELANTEYAKHFDKYSPILPPSKKIAVVICMDARINPNAILGFTEGDARVITQAEESIHCSIIIFATTIRYTISSGRASYRLWNVDVL